MATKKQSRTGKPVQTQKAGGQAVRAPGRSPFEEMDRFFESFFPRAWLRPLRWDLPGWPEAGMPFEGRMPRVDVLDQGDRLVVKAELPGIKRDQLDVNLHDNTLTIRGNTRHEEEKAEGAYHRREISSGSFSRTIALPAEVESDEVKASFKDGILELTMPKTKKSARKNIPIED